MEPPSTHSISILNSTDSPELEARLRAAVSTVLEDRGITGGDVSVLLCSSDEITRLNRQFRGIDHPTDVLTFPAGDVVVPDGSRVIGDIAICVEAAVSQANERGIQFVDELCYLAIHGALHLCGVGDETPEEFNAMQKAMAEYGERIGLPQVRQWTTLGNPKVNSA